MQMEREYTIPFFLFPKEVSTPYSELQSDLTNISNPQNISFAPVKVTLKDALQALGPSVADSNACVDNMLEQATAVSAWLHYLSATDLKHGVQVPISSVFVSLGLNGFVSYLPKVKY